MEDFALRLVSFAAVAGCAEMLLPEGKTKRAFEALLGLMAAKMVLDTAVRMLGSI